MGGISLEKNVCPWCEGHPLLYEYHNREWGIPVHDDKKHFEFLSMEVMQCGLSWLLALKKRKAFNEAFFDFDYLRVAAFNEDDIQTALKTRNMLRSERKIRAVVNNARVFIKIREEYGSFDNWIWSFTDNKTYVYKSHQYDCPATNDMSDKISDCLKARGMRYLGSITIYAYLQSAGLINDHWNGCDLYRYINENYPICIMDD